MVRRQCGSGYVEREVLTVSLAFVGNAVCSMHNSILHHLDPPSQDRRSEPNAATSLPLSQADLANLIRFLRELEALAKRKSPRIAFKAKGKILFLDLTEIVAVQAEGNYVSLRHRPNPYLLRESLSSMAEKLKPFGFIRIHRSVLVNIAAVEEIQPLPTGEYRLRVKGGKEYLVTRTYKSNLCDVAQLWLGPELPFGGNGNQKASFQLSG